MLTILAEMVTLNDKYYRKSRINGGKMFRFTKDMEYALISLVELSRMPPNQLVSARELSERCALPFKLLARILGKLGSAGVIRAFKGPHGGYCLVEPPDQVKLGRIIAAVRGDERIADCLAREGSCAQDARGCTIKPVIELFQDKWITFVENTTLDEFVRSELNPRRGMENAGVISEGARPANRPR